MKLKLRKRSHRSENPKSREVTVMVG